MFLNNRYYDPTTGIFTSIDPLVSKTGQPYLYANGNPTSMSDPSGLSPWGFDDWLLNMFFGSVVHSMIQADYMTKYSDAYAEVSYKAQDPETFVTVRGRIDVAALDPSDSSIPHMIALNEIRPTAESAEAELKARERAIWDGGPTTIKVPQHPEIGGVWKTSRDGRPYEKSFSILGIRVRAQREGDGIITYSYGSSDGDMDWRDLLPLLRFANRNMRNARDRNVQRRQDDFDAHAPKPVSSAEAWIGAGILAVGGLAVAAVASPAIAIGGGAVGLTCYATGMCSA